MAPPNSTGSTRRGSGSTEHLLPSREDTKKAQRAETAEASSSDLASHYLHQSRAPKPSYFTQTVDALNIRPQRYILQVAIPNPFGKRRPEDGKLPRIKAAFGTTFSVAQRNIEKDAVAIRNDLQTDFDDVRGHGSAAEGHFNIGARRAQGAAMAAGIGSLAEGLDDVGVTGGAGKVVQGVAAVGVIGFSQLSKNAYRRGQHDTLATAMSMRYNNASQEMVDVVDASSDFFGAKKREASVNRNRAGLGLAADSLSAVGWLGSKAAEGAAFVAGRLSPNDTGSHNPDLDLQHLGADFQPDEADLIDETSKWYRPFSRGMARRDRLGASGHFIESLRDLKNSRAASAASSNQQMLEEEQKTHQEKRENAAIKIEAVQRGIAGRGVAAALKEERHQEKRENAAIKIEAVQRGIAGRRVAAGLREVHEKRQDDETLRLLGVTGGKTRGARFNEWRSGELSTHTKLANSIHAGAAATDPEEKRRHHSEAREHIRTWQEKGRTGLRSHPAREHTMRSLASHLESR